MTRAVLGSTTSGAGRAARDVSQSRAPEHGGAVATGLRRLAQTRIGRRVAGSVRGVETAEPVFGVTFDDGPHPVVTPAVLDLLDSRHASATFFMRAGRALAHPDLARAVAARGHEVGVHGFDHLRMTELGPRGFGRETASARRALHRIVGGAAPDWFRPPYGAQNVRTFLATRAQGMRVAVWAADVDDATRTDGMSIVPGPGAGLTLRVPGRRMPLSPGHILLLHDTPAAEDGPDGAARKIALIERILDGIDAAGGRVVTLTELLEYGPPDRRVWRSAGY